MMCCTISDMMKLKQDYPGTSFAVQEIGGIVLSVHATYQEPMQAPVPGWGFLPAAEMAKRQASGHYSCQIPLCAPKSSNRRVN